MAANTTPPESEQPQAEPTQEGTLETVEPSLRDLFHTALVGQSEIVGTLELEVQHHSALAEASQKQLEYERSILRLMARYDAGLLNAEEQLELWNLSTSPERRKRTDPDMKGTYLLGDLAAEQAATRASEVGSESSPSTGLQDEMIRPTDDLT
jgi:hypothetical protein